MTKTFVDGFADELTKVARAPMGLLSRIPGKAKAIGALAGAGGLYAAGRHSGVKKEEGVAIGATQQAYQMGVQRGAVAMRDALLKQLGQGISERE